MDDSTFMALFFWGIVIGTIGIKVAAHFFGFGHFIRDYEDDDGAGESYIVHGGSYGSMSDD